MRGFSAVLLIPTAVVVSAQSSPDRSRPPALGPAPGLTLPTIDKRQLSNGLAVWMVELREVPVVQVNLVIGAGTADDPPNQYGVASMAAALLTEGAGTRSALELADAIDFLGATLTATTVGFDATAVRLHVPVTRLNDALPLMADVTLRPTFPGPELERLRQQRLTGLLQSRDDASTIASLAFSRVIYGRSHRFGTAAMGTADSIKAMSTERLRAFYADAFRPDNATLIVVGDVAPGQLLPMLEANFGAWKAAGPKRPRPDTAPVAPRSKREVYLVDKPGAPQSQIRIGSLGVSRATPDYFPIQVMNTILGGSFSSRLNMNLREEHGYTYGASSVFDMRVQPGPFYAAAGVQTDKTSEALREFFRELTGIQQPVPADELARARNYVALRFPAGFETTGDISRRLEDMLIFRLPDTYFTSYVPGIQQVSVDDVRRIAGTYLRPDTMAVVIVGDRAAIEAGVRSLNLGPITVLPLDEVFGS